MFDMLAFSKGEMRIVIVFAASSDRYRYIPRRQTGRVQGRLFRIGRN